MQSRNQVTLLMASFIASVLLVVGGAAITARWTKETLMIGSGEDASFQAQHSPAYVTPEEEDEARDRKVMRVLVVMFCVLLFVGVLTASPPKQQDGKNGDGQQHMPPPPY